MALGLGIFALAPLASCSNEETPTLPEIQEVEVNPDGTIPVTLSIPLAELNTRASSEATDDEAKVQDLWICAFPAGSNPGEKKIENIISGETSLKHGLTFTENDYTKFSNIINLKQGEYHIVVLANVSTYGIEPSNFEDEDDVYEAILGFNNKFHSSTGLSVNNLPMICEHKDIKDQIGGTALTVNNPLEISKTKNTIVAEMSLLCAKVRYTVLFDLTDFSEPFHSVTANEDFDVPTATKVRLETYIDTDSESTVTYNSDSSPLNLNITKYAAPSDATKKDSFTALFNSYAAMTTALTSPLDDFSKSYTSTTSFTTEEVRVWQGTVYLPENTATAPSGSENDDRTTIKFNPKGESNIGSADKDGNPIGFFKQTLERGNYYDIVAKLVSPGTYYYNVNVYVKVNPWDYKPQNVIPW